MPLIFLYQMNISIICNILCAMSDNVKESRNSLCTCSVLLCVCECENFAANIFVQFCCAILSMYLMSLLLCFIYWNLLFEKINATIKPHSHHSNAKKLMWLSIESDSIWIVITSFSIWNIALNGEGMQTAIWISENFGLSAWLHFRI